MKTIERRPQDENGRVLHAEVRESSGHPELDEGARKVGLVFRFSPAERAGEQIPFWVTVPIRFTTSRD